MRAVETQEWEFEAAQTDLAILTPPSNQQFSIVAATVTVAASSVAVSARIAFATTAILAYTINGSSGVSGVFFSHGGIPSGGGWTQSGDGATGATAQPIRLTCSVPTGGSIRVVIKFTRLTPDS